jgi:hypothetical protein
MLFIQMSSLELLEVRPVSPLDAHPFSLEEYSPESPQPPPHQRLPPPQSDNESWRHIPLANDDITESRSLRWEATTSKHENEVPMLDTKLGSSFLQREQKNAVQGSSLETKTQKFFLHWILAFSSATVSIFSTAYAYRVLVSQDAVPESLAITPGQTVLVVNILSHMVAFMCWTLFSNTTEALRWALACRTEGVLLTSFLALSRATPLGGVAYLCVVRGHHQIWSLQRFFRMMYN